MMQAELFPDAPGPYAQVPSYNNTQCPQRTVAVNARTQEERPRARARRNDRKTSHDAAASVSNISATQQIVWDAFAQYGAMADAALVLLLTGTPLSPSGIRTRRAELVALGKLVDSGKTTTLPSGRQSTVWRTP